MRKKKKTTRRRNSGVVESLEREHRQSSETIERIGAQLDSLEEEIASVNGYILEDQEEIKYWGEERREHEKAIRESITEGNKAAASLQKHKAQIAKLKNSIRPLQSQYDKRLKDLKELAAQIRALGGRV